MDAEGFSTLRIAPTRYLGLDYNKFKSNTYKKCLVNPSSYYELRQKVEEKLQTQAIGALYDTIYHALSTGTEADGATSLGFDDGIPPAVPLQKINEICLSACETLNEIIVNEVLELLLPLDFNKIMNSRLKQKGDAITLGDV
jgi:hypothetical protein